MIEYEERMMNVMQQVKASGYNKAICGDIFLEDLKNTANKN